MFNSLFMLGESAGIDGGLIRNLEEANAVTRIGHRAYIFLTGNPEFNDYDHLIRGYFFPGQNRVSWHLNNTVSLMARIRKALETTSADLIHVQVPTPLTRGLTATVLKKIRKIPFVADVHDLWSDPSLANLPHQRVSERVVKEICRNAGAIVIASPRVGNLLQRLGFEDLFLVPNGVNTDVFNLKVDPSVVRRKLGWGGGEQVIIYVGAVSEQSGLDTLVRASQLLLEKGYSNIRCLVVGDGPKRATLQAMVSDTGLGNYWVFTGAVPHRLVPLYISSADICVAPYLDLPSIRAGSSMKAPEYLACGKPLVFSGIDREIAKSGACIAVPSGDAAALSRSIGGLLEDRRLRLAMGEKGWNYVSQHLSWDVLAKTIVDAYSKAMAS